MWLMIYYTYLVTKFIFNNFNKYQFIFRSNFNVLILKTAKEQSLMTQSIYENNTSSFIDATVYKSLQFCSLWLKIITLLTSRIDISFSIWIINSQESRVGIFSATIDILSVVLKQFPLKIISFVLPSFLKNYIATVLFS